MATCQLPRLKNTGIIRLYRRSIRWDVIAQQYDQTDQYAPALRLGCRGGRTGPAAGSKAVENWKSAPTVMHYGKDSALTSAHK
ncbi:hypothetical protein ACVB8X_27490 [Streptomyces sp. NRAIS4]